MPHVRELFESSVLVIVRYHQAKLPSSDETEEAKLQQLLQKPHAEFIAALEALIDAAVTSRTQDEARRPLLMYILHNIGVIKSFLDSTVPLEESEFNLIEHQLIQYIANIQCLLNLSHGKEKTIHYNKLDVNMWGLKKEVELFGFKSGALGAYTFTVSGNIIINALFPALKLSIDESPNTTISLMLNVHQRSLLSNQVRELSTERDDLQTTVVTLQQTKLVAQETPRQDRSRPINQTPRPQAPKVQRPPPDHLSLTLRNVVSFASMAAGFLFFPGEDPSHQDTPPQIPLPIIEEAPGGVNGSHTSFQ